MWKHNAVILAIRIAAVVGAVVVMERLCVIPFRHNAVMRVVHGRSKSIAASTDPYRRAALARENINDLRGTSASQRLNASWYLLYAFNCEVLERWPEATQIYTQALRFDQRPEIYFNRGMAALRVGDVDAAVEDMARAVRFKPSYLDTIDGELRARVAAAARP